MSDDSLGLRSDRSKQPIDIIVAAVTVVSAVALVLAYWSIKHQERIFRLKFTQEVLDKFSEERSDGSQRGMLLKFKGRWTKVIEPMSEAEAHRYFEISKEPDNSEEAQKWKAARRHLNFLEDVAHAYISGLADKDDLAAAGCLEITRSYRYFAPLIRGFTDRDRAHGWSAIQRAAQLLEIAYGSECEKIQGGFRTSGERS